MPSLGEPVERTHHVGQEIVLEEPCESDNLAFVGGQDVAFPLGDSHRRVSYLTGEFQPLRGISRMSTMQFEILPDRWRVTKLWGPFPATHILLPTAHLHLGLI